MIYNPKKGRKRRSKCTIIRAWYCDTPLLWCVVYWPANCSLSLSLSLCFLSRLLTPPPPPPPSSALLPSLVQLQSDHMHQSFAWRQPVLLVCCRLQQRSVEINLIWREVPRATSKLQGTPRTRQNVFDILWLAHLWRRGRREKVQRNRCWSFASWWTDCQHWRRNLPFLPSDTSASRLRYGKI